jgi:Na+-transporting NADH:ubiquinone oxidoreductase subunit NqrD
VVVITLVTIKSVLAFAYRLNATLSVFVELIIYLCSAVMGRFEAFALRQPVHGNLS